MKFPLKCKAYYRDETNQVVDTFREDIPIELSFIEICDIKNAFSEMEFSWDYFDALFPEISTKTTNIQLEWPRYAEGRRVRMGKMFELMMLNYGNFDQLVQEDIQEKGFVPNTQKDDPSYKESLYKEWTKWEDKYIRSLPLDTRLKYYKDRYRINITKYNLLDFDFWFKMED